MVKADPNAWDCFYICNPNNPSGTITSRTSVAAVEQTQDSILLLDEAYIHFSEATLGSDLVAADKDVVILRTFSRHMAWPESAPAWR